MPDRRLDILCSRPIVAGKDGNKLYVSLDSAKDAMDEYMKETCLELLEYMAKNEYKCFWMEDEDGEPYYFFSKGVGYQNLTKEELFENFL